MNIKPHTMIAILLAGGVASASDEHFLVSKTELENHDNACESEIPRRLCEHGVLMPTGDGNLYLLNPSKMRDLPADESLQLLKDLTSWLSKREHDLQIRDWRGMRPSSQDYAAE